MRSEKKVFTSNDKNSNRNIDTTTIIIKLSRCSRMYLVWGLWNVILIPKHYIQIDHQCSVSEKQNNSLVIFIKQTDGNTFCGEMMLLIYNDNHLKVTDGKLITNLLLIAKHIEQHFRKNYQSHFENFNKLEIQFGWLMSMKRESKKENNTYKWLSN